jgi:hypothetical protein
MVNKMIILGNFLSKHDIFVKLQLHARKMTYSNFCSILYLMMNLSLSP